MIRSLTPQSAAADEECARCRIQVAIVIRKMIEPEIGRKFGLLVSEDDFSAAGDVEYRPPRIGGKEVDLNQFFRDLHQTAALISEAATRRDGLKKKGTGKSCHE